MDLNQVILQGCTTHLLFIELPFKKWRNSTPNNTPGRQPLLNQNRLMPNSCYYLLLQANSFKNCVRATSTIISYVIVLLK